jgi:predicted TIM-barrel enzyme
VFDGTLRQSLAEPGMGYGLEVAMIAAAHELDLLTTPYVFNPDEAIAMTKAGADIIVAHMGVTTGGTIGASSAKSLDQCVIEINAIAAAARGVRPNIIVICHGGPISMPGDARHILEHCKRIHGFYGASSMERLPAETAILNQTAEFKALPLRNSA